MNVNDNEFALAARYPAPDPHGHAALLLVESLIHGLIARDALTVPEALEVIEVATTVKQEAGEEMGDTAATLARSLGLLHAIGVSLARDA